MKQSASVAASKLGPGLQQERPVSSPRRKDQEDIELKGRMLSVIRLVWSLHGGK